MKKLALEVVIRSGNRDFFNVSLRNDNKNKQFVVTFNLSWLQVHEFMEILKLKGFHRLEDSYVFRSLKFSFGSSYKS